MGPYQVQFADNAFPTEELGANRIVEGHAPFPSEEDSARGMNGRPSLRSLRHRVTYHDDGFSSGGEVSELLLRGSQSHGQGFHVFRSSHFLLMWWFVPMCFSHNIGIAK